jgi:hypothetical protein
LIWFASNQYIATECRGVEATNWWIEVKES